MRKFLIILFAVMALVACKDKRDDLELSGDCEIIALAMDQYEAVIDHFAGSAKVMLPKGYSMDSLAITRLELSQGAKANYEVGQVLNLREAKRMVVINGDVTRAWVISALNESAEITYFDLDGLYPGVINQTAKTIVVTVPAGVDVTSMRPTITVTEGATVDPASGLLQNFENPVVYTVKSKNLETKYTVTVKQVGNPKALFIGNAATLAELQPEEQAACTWMMSNIDETLYASLDEVRTGKYNLSECKVIFWHMHEDVSIDSKAKFEENAPQAAAAVPAIQAYLNAGGNLLLSRYATYLPGYLSINGNPATDRFPNNCWLGRKENDPETTTEAWHFSCAGHTDHPVFQGLLGDGNAEKVYTCDAGYQITNTTCQWHIGTDWGGIATHDDFRTQTGATDIAHGGDGAVVVWEFPSSASNGGIICIGSGAYDWYSVNESYTGYHKNVETITLNAINYLIGK